MCKFFLKKKLGQFLLGEIDIDQLDVQLSEGTIQLNDLALNVDFLNDKVILLSLLVLWSLAGKKSNLFFFLEFAKDCSQERKGNV